MLLAGVLVLGSGTSLTAQQLEIKRVLLGAGLEGCPTAASLAPVAPEAAERAALLLAEAQQTVLIGEYAMALSYLAEGARLDPTHAELAYHRARLLEEVGDLHGAAGEYCRFLALEVQPEDAREAHTRLLSMAGAAGTAAPDSLVVAWHRHAIAHLDRGDASAAITAFSHVLQLQPELAEAYFNRAVLRLARGQRRQAAEDLRSYLLHAPDATDRVVVAQQLELILAARPMAPAATLIGGLIVPGLGQFTTERPVYGALVSLSATGAVALALRSRETGRVGAVTDPTGNSSGEARRNVERPYRMAGFAAAVAITTFGAVEAYLYRQRSTPAGAATLAAEKRSWHPVIEPLSGGLGVGLAVELARR